MLESSVCMECGVRVLICFFFQAEDGIRDLVRSRGLGDVYKRQVHNSAVARCQAFFCARSGGIPPLMRLTRRASHRMLSLIHI